MTNRKSFEKVNKTIVNFHSCLLLYIDINECDDSPCVNGACNNTAGSFTCDCTGTGFDGALCQNSKAYMFLLIDVNEFEDRPLDTTTLILLFSAFML